MGKRNQKTLGVVHPGGAEVLLELHTNGMKEGNCMLSRQQYARQDTTTEFPSSWSMKYVRLWRRGSSCGMTVSVGD